MTRLIQVGADSSLWQQALRVNQTEPEQHLSTFLARNSQLGYEISLGLPCRGFSRVGANGSRRTEVLTGNLPTRASGFIEQAKDIHCAARKSKQPLVDLFGHRSWRFKNSTIRARPQTAAPGSRTLQTSQILRLSNPVCCVIGSNGEAAACVVAFVR